MLTRTIGRIAVMILSLYALAGCRKTEVIDPDPPPAGPVEVIAYAFQPGTAGDIHKIYTINSDGTENRQAVFANIGLNHLSWSPDGTKFALVGYMDNTNLTWSIHTVNVDGSNLTRLTTVANVQDSEPSWSPNGLQIAFTRMFPLQNDRNELWLMDGSGSNQHYIGIEGLAAKWSPDGSRFIYTSNRSGNHEIYTCNIDGTNELQLTHSGGDEWMPIWSPDGNQIAYSLSTGTWEAGSRTTYEIFVMNSDGSNIRQLTSNNFFDFYPRWSANGTRIAFESDRSAAEHWEVYVMNADGSNVGRVTNSPGGYTAICPVWRPLAQ
jgi:TolB protein